MDGCLILPFRRYEFVQREGLNWFTLIDFYFGIIRKLKRPTLVGLGVFVSTSTTINLVSRHKQAMCACRFETISKSVNY